MPKENQPIQQSADGSVVKPRYESPMLQQSKQHFEVIFDRFDDALRQLED